MKCGKFEKVKIKAVFK